MSRGHSKLLRISRDHRNLLRTSGVGAGFGASLSVGPGAGPGPSARTGTRIVQADLKVPSQLELGLDWLAHAY